MELIDIHVLIHRNRKDILTRVFIVSREIGSIIILQHITLLCQFITIVDTGFPGIQLVVSIDDRLVCQSSGSIICVMVLYRNVQDNILSSRAVLITGRPVVIGIDFSIQRQLSQQEVCYRLCDTPIELPLFVAMFVREKRRSLLQLVKDKTEDCTARHLSPIHT